MHKWCKSTFELKAMKTIRLKTIGLTGLFLGIILLFSCSENEEAWFPVVGQGNLKTEVRSFEPFTKVKYQISGDVLIQPGTNSELKALAQENLLPLLETEVVDGTLYISFGSRAIETDSTVVIQVSSTQIQEFTLSGSGNVVSCLGIPVINLTGKGNISCTGEAEQVAVKLSGCGKVDLDKMTIRKANVKITGNGDVSLHVTDNLDVIIQGLGIVYYHGMPKIQKNITGRGQVIEDN